MVTNFSYIIKDKSVLESLRESVCKKRSWKLIDGLQYPKIGYLSKKVFNKPPVPPSLFFSAASYDHVLFHFDVTALIHEGIDGKNNLKK